MKERHGSGNRRTTVTCVKSRETRSGPTCNLGSDLMSGVSEFLGANVRSTVLEPAPLIQSQHRGTTSKVRKIQREFTNIKHITL